jgi:cytochrome c-type biogenesis protein CcmH
MTWLFLLMLSFSGIAFAVQPNEMLPDPKLEARARSISAELRCLVCQNQSIDDSDADLAHDLRMLVRQRLQAGDSDEQVKQFLVNRYGDYILLDPPLNAATFVLWFGPVFFLLLAAGLIWFNFGRARPKRGNS